VFTFLVLTFGPFNVLAPFVSMTSERDAAFRRRLALEGTLIAAFAMLVAVTVGTRALKVWGVSSGALYVASGIILFLVALRPVLAQYAPREPRVSAAAESPSASVSALAFALAFPTIVTPYGIAVLVLLMTLAPEQSPGWRLILGVAGAVLVIDLITMLNAQRILKAAYVPAVLGVVGTVMAVLQIALAVQAVVVGLRLLRIV
jgi:multiple antibiotic resistance protein